LFSRAKIPDKPCKFCRQPIPRRASKCPHCGEYQSVTKHFRHPTFFVTFVSMVVSIYSAKLAYTYKVDASDAFKEATVAKEQVIQQKELIKLWADTLDTVNIKDPEQGIKYTTKILEKEEDWLAYDMQGSAYKSLAKKYRNEDKKRELLNKALAAFKRSSELNNSSRSAIEVANIYAYFGEEEKCKEWLKKAQQYDQLPTYDWASKYEWLFKYSNEPWFEGIKWKVYE
jgi:tetratricopeptide (TPR) repeat protein